MSGMDMKSSNALRLSRRDFMRLSAQAAAALAAGCATNPVTGQKQLMLMSENQEIQVDKQYSPHQFSNDYGELQDKHLNAYLEQTGRKMADHTHRPQMPYTFRGVNATYVNAYAFPGGSIAATRGILLNLESEAELAGLLGHELGHVNARHSAEQMSKGMISQAVVGGLAVYAGTRSDVYGKIVSAVGAVGASALLAKYSRDNEREADALGMQYMARSEYDPRGMVDLMDMLREMSHRKPSVIETMFASHPMSDERYATAVERSRGEYAQARNLPMHKERYMDETAGLRSIKGAIEEMQKGETLMAQKKYQEAEARFDKALRSAPEDYAGLVMMSKCLLAQKKPEQARRYAEQAKQVNPGEAQAHQLNGITALQQKRFDAAYANFDAYDNLLPGNPDIAFFKGLSLEKMNQPKRSAREYYRYLQMVKEGDQARYAYQRLVGWGYVK